MHTKADVKLTGGGRTAMLSLNGKQLQARILAPAAAQFEVRAADPLPTSPNPAGQRSNDGVRKLAIHFRDAEKVRLSVEFIPQDGGGEVPLTKPKPLSEW